MGYYVRICICCLLAEYDVVKFSDLSPGDFYLLREGSRRIVFMKIEKLLNLPTNAVDALVGQQALVGDSVDVIKLSRIEAAKRLDREHKRVFG